MISLPNPLTAIGSAARLVPSPGQVVRAGVAVPRAAAELGIGLTRTTAAATLDATVALAGNLGDALVALGPRRRRIWAQGHHVHLELRQLEPEDLEALAPAIELLVDEVDGVEWAEVNHYTNRLVVSLADPVRIDEVTTALELAEAALDLEHEPFPSNANHPSDRDQIGLATLELGVDAVALVASVVRRLQRGDRRPAAGDVAQLVLALQYLPHVRRVLEGRARRPVLDLGVTVLASGVAVAGGRPISPVIGFIEHGLRLHGANARHGAWAAREPDLCAKPAAGGLVRVKLPPRPPVPDGPMEEAARWIPPGALGAAAASVPLLRSRERAAGLLATAAPRATRVGRTVFSDAIHHTLAHRGVVALDSSALDLLDRVDVALFDAAVLIDELAAIDQIVPLRDDTPAEAWTIAERLLDPFDLGGIHELGSWTLGPLDAGALDGHPAAAERVDRAATRPGTTLLALHRRRSGARQPVLVAAVVARPRLRSGATTVLDAVRRADLELRLITDQPLVAEAIGADHVVAPDLDLVGAIRDLQESDHVVWLTAPGPPDALAAADIGLGLPDPLGPAAWSADLLGNDLGDAVVVAEACRVARTLSRQNATLSIAG